MARSYPEVVWWSRTSTSRPGVSPNAPYHRARMVATWTVSTRPYRSTRTEHQDAAAASSARRPSRAPFFAGRPRRPVRAGGGPYKAALAGSRVVIVVPVTTSGISW